MKKNGNYEKMLRNGKRNHRRELTNRETLNRKIKRWPSASSASHSVTKRRATKIIQSRPELNLPAPQHFSLLDNTEETLNFFEKLSRETQKLQPIFVDLSNVLRLDLGTILYLLSIMQQFIDKKIPYRIRGNTPTDPKSKKMMVDTNFQKYVQKGNLSRDTACTDIVEIATGTEVDPNYTKTLVDFCERHHGAKFTYYKKSLYCTIQELMTNTRYHAGEREGDTRWWMTAVYESTSNRVHFTFLDNGATIPATVAKHNLIEWLPTLRPSAEELVLSALRGEFRTRTKERHRGLGLPDIDRRAKNGHLKNLEIVSGAALVDVANSKGTKLTLPFRGTLVRWSVELELDDE